MGGLVFVPAERAVVPGRPTTSPTGVSGVSTTPPGRRPTARPRFLNILLRYAPPGPARNMRFLARAYVPGPTFDPLVARILLKTRIALLT